MIIEEKTNIRLLTVMECSWGAKDVLVSARPFAAVSIRLKGCAEITEDGKTEQMRTGDVLYMPAHASYRLKCEDEHILVLHFDAVPDAEMHMRVFRMSDTTAVRTAFTELLSVWQSKGEGYYFKALSIFYRIMYELSIGCCEKQSEKQSRIRQAVEYMHSNYTDPRLTVTELCRRAFMSDTYFRRLFREIYGKNPIDYLNGLRLSHAKVLLMETASAVGEVAALSGFSDVKYFSTFFKRQFGITPSEYKKTRSKEVGCDFC